MADEQYKWLDRDAAERLLRGEPLEFVDVGTRDQAGRLAEALGALSTEPPLTSAELPGEADALAAFRKARADRCGEQTSLGDRGRTHAAASSDVGLVRLGRPTAGRRGPSRWNRPLRFGLAAALAAGMIGGVTAVAATGVLPFAGDNPEPGASVSADAPRRPLISPSPDATGDDPRPDGGIGDGSSSQGPQNSPDSRDGAPGSGTAAPGAGSDDKRNDARSRDWWNGVVSSCRDVRDGKSLDAQSRRSLEEAAHGAGRVRDYCKSVLKQSEGRSGAAGTGSASEKKDDKGSDDNGSDGEDGRGHGRGWDGNSGKDDDGRGHNRKGDDD